VGELKRVGSCWALNESVASPHPPAPFPKFGSGGARSEAEGRGEGRLIRILLALVPPPTYMRSLQVPAERVHRVASGLHLFAWSVFSPSGKYGIQGNSFSDN